MFTFPILAVRKVLDRGIIDAEANTITLNVEEAELERRRAAWTAPPPRYTRGVLAKYAKTVSSASLGAITDGD